MAKFYATGSKVVTEVVNGEKVTKTASVIIDNLPSTRVGAVNEADRIAKKEKINLDGVFIVKGSNVADKPMTKNAKKRKALRGSRK